MMILEQDAIRLQQEFNQKFNTEINKFLGKKKKYGGALLMLMLMLMLVLSEALIKPKVRKTYQSLILLRRVILKIYVN